MAPALLIDHRPQIVEHRVRVGDWAGGLIIGRGGLSAIGTLVDRTSRYVKLVYLPERRTAPDLQEAMARAMATLPVGAWLTLTWDQGSEMAAHDKIGAWFPDGIYFAHPGSPWQRGSNENTNGLLRQYFPKGTDLSVHDLTVLQGVEERLNHRPRKTLGWKTPAEVFAADLPSGDVRVATVTRIHRPGTTTRTVRSPESVGTGSGRCFRMARSVRIQLIQACTGVMSPNTMKTPAE